jgi:hypothetical protein
MADSFRALCAELVDALDSGIPTGRICMSPLANRARAALAEPDGCDFPVCIDDDSEEGTCSRWLAGSCEGPASATRAALAEPEGTDGEVPRIGHILRLAEIIREVDGKHDKGAAALAEAILSHPGIRSAGLTAALAEPEAVGPTNEELVNHVGWFADEACLENSSGDIADSCRELIARWGRPAAPVPVLPDDAQIIEPAEHTLLVPVAAPVPVSERLPGPEDCDEQGRCWLWERDCGYSGCKWALVDRTWSLSQSDEDLSVYTHWLPANALPLPAPEGGEVS